MSIYNIIDRIRKHPSLYLGGKSISSLLHYLDGYQTAEREFNANQSGILFPLSFSYMHEYTRYRLKNTPYSMGWCDRILCACGGDEEAALWKFFEYYDGFIRVRMRRYWKAILSRDNIAWNNQMEHTYCLRPKKTGHGAGPYSFDELTFVKEPIYLDPLNVYIIELTIPAYILAVETASDIQLTRSFFTSLESAKGIGHCEGAEKYFGPVDAWEELTARTISFSKNIVI